MGQPFETNNNITCMTMVDGDNNTNYNNNRESHHRRRMSSASTLPTGGDTLSSSSSGNEDDDDHHHHHHERAAQDHTPFGTVAAAAVNESSSLSHQEEQEPDFQAARMWKGKTEQGQLRLPETVQVSIRQVDDKQQQQKQQQLDENQEHYPYHSFQMENFSRECCKSTSTIRTTTAATTEEEVEKASPSPIILPCRQQIQEILHRRSREEALLRQAFEESCRGGGGGDGARKNNHLILISGEPGSGKSRLAKSTLQPPSHGAYFFLSGKFDQLQRAAPYTAFVNAFTDWTYQVVHGKKTELQRIRYALDQAIVGTDKNVLTGMIPALEAVLGGTTTPTTTPSSSSSTLAIMDNRNVNVGDKNGDDGEDDNSKEIQLAATNKSKGGEGALHRFVFVFGCFIRALCSPEKPLVLFLDDLQFADMCSLDLLYSIASDPKNNNSGLVLVATCDDTMVKPNSYLASKLRDLEDQNKAKITNIALHNLKESDISVVLRDTLRLEGQQNEILTRLLVQKTGGNISFMIEFLTWMQDHAFLSADPRTGQWTVDEERAKSISGITCDTKFSNFLLNVMRNLPPGHQDMLKVGACMGNVVNQTLVGYVLEDDGLPEILEDLQTKGFFCKANSSSQYEFTHDGIQSAAYQLIPADEAEIFHLEIGRRIWRKLASEDVDKYLFTILSQMNIGRNLIKEDEEKAAVAHLCLFAGNKAARASTFRTAAVYLDLGLSLMDEKRWRTDYDLMLALHNASAEMEMCRASFNRMNEVLTETLRHARIFEDKVQAYMTQIYALSSQTHQLEAIDIGIKALSGLGEGLPRKTSLFKLISEYRSVKKLLRGRSDESILRMDRMVDESKLQALLIVNAMMLPVILERPDLAPFLLLKSIKITLQHGLSVLAANAFATYGMFCITVEGNIAQGKRFGQLGLALLDRFKAMEYLPAVYAGVYGCIQVWYRPISETLQPLLEANRIGFQTGNFEFAGLNANQYCFNALGSGVPLDEILSRWQGFNETMSTNKQASLLRMAMPCIQAVRTYMGCGSDPNRKCAAVLDYDEALQKAVETGSNSTIIVIKYCRMKLNFMFGDYEGAFRHRVTMSDIKKMSGFERSIGLFYLGMTSIQLAHMKIEARRNSKRLLKCLKPLRRWAISCPQNFMGQVSLLEAELSSFRGKNEEAFQKYFCAIATAKASNFRHIAGLANERLALHLQRTGQSPAAARPYWEASRECYREWKAQGLVDRADKILMTL